MVSKHVHARTPLAAMRAVQRVLVVVHCQLVLPGVTVQCRPYTALRARVRHLTSVGQQGNGEMAPLRERFSALGEHVTSSAFGRVLPPPVTHLV